MVHLPSPGELKVAILWAPATVHTVGGSVLGKYITMCAGRAWLAASVGENFVTSQYPLAPILCPSSVFLQNIEVVLTLPLS